MRILVISAMPVEQEDLISSLYKMSGVFSGVDAIVDFIPYKEFIVHNSITDTLNTINFAICGIGKVNAAIATSLLISKLKPDLVINYGLAGGINSKFNIGDIVLSSIACYHDVDASALGYPVGMIPDATFPGVFISSSIDYKKDFERICKISCQEGLVASGDQFISSSAKKQEILRNFRADCVEMEGAAIAHVSYLFNTPFLLIRVISDNGEDGAFELYQKNEGTILQNFSKSLIQFLMEVSIIG